MTIRHTLPTIPRALLSFALLSAAAAAQEESTTDPREPRSFVPPPPSATSTGGAPDASEPLEKLRRAPQLRGREMATRDALHPDEIVLVGLEQSETPYRPDLSLDRTPLAAGAPVDEEDLHRRQLAIYAGERVTTLPEIARRPNLEGPDTPKPRGDAVTGGATSRWSLLLAAAVALAVLRVGLRRLLFVRRASGGGAQTATTAKKRRARADEA